MAEPDASALRARDLAAEAWAEVCEPLGLQLSPLGLQLAERVGPAARVIGVDGVFSRFGVMRFSDSIAAFAGFRRMLKPSARLAFVCWRPLEENELDLLPLRAAGLEHLIDHTPFCFADPDTVHAILKAAGFSRVTIQAHDEAVSSGDRALSDRASAALAAMPVVVLTAARQTGKSLLAWRDSQLLRPEICYWRTASGDEVDFMIEQKGKLMPIEVKTTSWPRVSDGRHLQAFREEYGKSARAGLMLHTGSVLEWLAPGSSRPRGGR